MKKLIIFSMLFSIITLTSCDMDFLPNDKIVPEQLSVDPSGAIYATDGNYAMFKDILIQLSQALLARLR
jgi:starch-binding outer membrane protein, SusD/RagB family